MGESQSKLTSERASDLKKKTHCEFPQQGTLIFSHRLTLTPVSQRELQKW